MAIGGCVESHPGHAGKIDLPAIWKMAHFIQDCHDFMLNYQGVQYCLRDVWGMIVLLFNPIVHSMLCQTRLEVNKN